MRRRWRCDSNSLLPSLTQLTFASRCYLRTTPQVLKVDHEKRDFGKEKLSGTLYYVHYKGWKASCVSLSLPALACALVVSAAAIRLDKGRL